MSNTMRAAYYEAFGEADNIKVGELDIPEVKEGEVLVRIKAAAVNPVDSVVRKGLLKDFIPTHFPVIPGWDMAGVVEQIQWGTFAEYIVIPESYLALRPQAISWEETAGIPLVGLTAYQSLYDAGGLQGGQTVLILGASGGVGTLGIQLAKAKGAKVIGVASEKNHAFMRELGADQTIDYHDNDIAGAVKDLYPDGVDLIFDAASGETLRKSIPALKKSGTLVSILHHGQGLDKAINFRYFFVEPNSVQLDHLRHMVDEGNLKILVSRTFSIDQTAEAMQQIETHHTKGKIVVLP